MPAGNQHIVREGVAAGLIGALAIATWFFVIDVVSGRMLGTPVMLGSSLATLFDLTSVSRPGAFLLYTVAHFALFLIVGLIFAWVAAKAERTPSALIGFVGLFVAFQVGWFGWTSVMAEGFGDIAWYQVFIANLIASACMGYYMYRQHPGLAAKVNRLIVTSD